MTRHFQWFGMTGIPLLCPQFILSRLKSKHLLTQNKCLADQLSFFSLLSLGIVLSFFERHVLTTYCQTLSKKTFHPIRYHSTSILTLPLLWNQRHYLPLPSNAVHLRTLLVCLSKCYLLLPLVKINSFLSSSPRCSFFVSHLYLSYFLSFICPLSPSISLYRFPSFFFFQIFSSYFSPSNYLYCLLFFRYFLFLHLVLFLTLSLLLSFSFHLYSLFSFVPLFIFVHLSIILHITFSHSSSFHILFPVSLFLPF